tara:strand:+ start:2091 stop:2672 length:582 start_codon:yes stop_codon:yes gene_type:complete
MKLLTTLSLLLLLFVQSACGPLAYKKTSAKEISADPKQRVEKNLTEGRGFRLSDQLGKNNNTYSFASSNPLWKATLEILDFMPLVSANYSGGIVITDWYSENDNPNQSIKITVKFLTNEIRSDALDIDIFVKECSQNSFNCSINKKNNALVAELSLSILKKAAIYEKQVIEEKKSKPYKFSKPKRKDKKKKKK